jgi:hypothetical protein
MIVPAKEELEKVRSATVEEVKEVGRRERERFEKFREEENEKIAEKVGHLGQPRREKEEEEAMWKAHLEELQIKDEEEIREEKAKMEYGLSECTCSGQELVKKVWKERKKEEEGGEAWEGGLGEAGGTVLVIYCEGDNGCNE